MKQKTGSPAYLTPAEVARQLLVAPVTVRQWARKGWLKAELTGGGHRRFLQAEVERFARERGLTLHAGTGNALDILVVDDDRQLAGYLSELLTGQPGIGSVAVAHDGFEAGIKVKTFIPDVILLDLMMPGLDGFNVCSMLKQDPLTRGIRVIAMTGFPSPENEQRILAAGAEACLGKPFDRDQLLQQLGIERPVAASSSAVE